MSFCFAGFAFFLGFRVVFPSPPFFFCFSLPPFFFLGGGGGFGGGFREGGD